MSDVVMHNGADGAAASPRWRAALGPPLGRAGRHDGRRQVLDRPPAGGAARRPFVDADTEIEKAAGMTIAEIFAAHGEPYFRAGEARVIARLLDGGPQVLATGGGAFMNADTRAAIRAKGISVWLRATLEVLQRRIKRRGDRPLLKNADPAETLRAADRRALSGLCRGRRHGRVARRAARHDRRRDRRRAARPVASRAAAGAAGARRHDRAAARPAIRSRSTSGSASAPTTS